MMMGSIEVEVDSGAAEDLVSGELLDGGLGPAAERDSGPVAEGGRAVVVRVPDRDAVVVGAGRPRPHDGLPHVGRGVNAHLFALGLQRGDELAQVGAVVGRRVAGPAAARAGVGLHVDPDHPVGPVLVPVLGQVHLGRPLEMDLPPGPLPHSRAQALLLLVEDGPDRRPLRLPHCADQLVDLVGRTLTPAGEHVDVGDEPCGVAVLDVGVDVGVHCTVGAVAADDGKGLPVALEAGVLRGQSAQVHSVGGLRPGQHPQQQHDSNYHRIRVSDSIIRPSALLRFPSNTQPDC